MRVQRVQRAEAPPLSNRWFLAALLAAVVIAGLLGMHTLSTAHSEPPLTTIAMDAGHVHAATSSMDAHVESGCADCATSGQYHVMIVACVLGLLATLLLICRAKPGLVRDRGPSIVAPFLQSAVSLLPRPPSLTALSISRT